MDKILELELRQSEARQELADLLESDADNEKVGALNVELRSLDRQLMAQKLVSPEPETSTSTGTPEGRELRQLVSRASLGKMMTGIADDAQGNGAERELRQARNLPDNYIPWDMLEKRAAVAVSGDEEGNTTPLDSASLSKWGGLILRRGCPDGRGRRDFGPGDKYWGNYRVCSGWGGSGRIKPGRCGHDVKSSQRDGEFPDRPGRPRRFPHDGRRLADGVDRRVQNAIDVDLLTLASKGLLKAGGTDPTAPSDATTAPEFLADVYGAVDGAMSSAVNMNRLLVGPEVYGYMGSLIYDAGSGMTVADKLASIGVQVLVTDNAGAYASNAQDGLVIVGPPRRNAVGVTWRGVEIIRDEFSLAANGQLKFTVLVMWDYANVRPDGFIRKSYRRS